MQTLATGAAEAEQTDGKAGKMTNTRSCRRKTYPDLLAKGAAKLAPHHGLRTRWVCPAVMGQGPLRHPIHGRKVSIWHPLEQLCPGMVKGSTKTTLGDCLGTWWLFPTISGTVPSLSAPTLVHQRSSAKSPKWRQVAEPLSLPHTTAYEGRSSSFQSVLHALHGHIHQPQPCLAGKPLQRGGYNSCIS